MATIKSYTDLEQSKKLAEILSLESADYFHAPDAGIVVTEPYKLNEDDETVITTYKGAIPCWSLAALLNVLPRFIEFKGDKYYLRFMKEYVEYANDGVSLIGSCLHTTGNNNLVDACHEMIIKLNELNLL